MQKTLSNILKFTLFLSVGLVILYLVYRNQNEAYQAQCTLDGVASADCSLIHKILTDFQRINYGWIAVVITCFIFSNWSRSQRWLMLLEPLGYKVKASNSFWSVNLGYFANLGLPRMGEVVRAATLARYEKMPVEKAMGTIVVDRLVDMLSLLLVVGLAFLLEFNTLYTYLNENMGKKSGGGLFQNPIIQGVLIAGFVGLLVLIIFWKKIQQLAIFQKVMTIAKGFLEGIASIRNVKNVWLFILHSLNIWFMYYMMMYFCFFAFPPTVHLSLVAALMVFTFGSFGIVIPSPGGMGTYHALVVAGLSLYHINGGDAFSFANIFFFSVNIFCCIVLGIIALILLPIINKEKEE
jgi:glycosyltransferase 2 family protein